LSGTLCAPGVPIGFLAAVTNELTVLQK